MCNACCHYIVNYISKDKAELSQALNSVMKHLQSPNVNMSLAKKFNELGNTFLNCSEFSAQECVYYILGLPICRARIGTVFSSGIR